MAKLKSYINGSWVELGGASIIEIEFANLVNLKASSKLTKGQLYRITNYIAYTSQSSTQSANKQFDIIVLADSANSFNENAWAINHVEDGFTDPFASCNLKAWEIKYCFDQDSTRFSWGGSSTYDHSEVDGKTITKTENELLTFGESGNVVFAAYLYADTDNTAYYNNSNTAVKDLTSLRSGYNISLEETSYVVANLSADKKSFTSVIDDVTYTFALLENGSGYYYDFSQEDEHYLCFRGDDGSYYFYVKESTLANGAPLIKAQSGSLLWEKTVTHIYTAPEGFRGIIYYMKDEWNNEAPFDFKGITYNSKYIFGGDTDGSLAGTAYGNVVAPNYDGKVLTLVDIYLPSQAYQNTLMGCSALHIEATEFCCNDFYQVMASTIQGKMTSTKIRFGMLVNTNETAVVNRCHLDNCWYVTISSPVFADNNLSDVIGASSAIIEFGESSSIQKCSFTNMGYFAITGTIASTLNNSSIENSKYVTLSAATLTNSKICNCNGDSSTPISFSGTMIASVISNSASVTITDTRLVKTTITDCDTLTMSQAYMELCSIANCKNVSVTYDTKSSNKSINYYVYITNCNSSYFELSKVYSLNVTNTNNFRCLSYNSYRNTIANIDIGIINLRGSSYCSENAFNGGSNFFVGVVPTTYNQIDNYTFPSYDFKEFIHNSFSGCSVLQIIANTSSTILDTVTLYSTRGNYKVNGTVYMGLINCFSAISSTTTYTTISAAADWKSKRFIYNGTTAKWVYES